MRRFGALDDKGRLDDKTTACLRRDVDPVVSKTPSLLELGWSQTKER
jgi:hypothetical protein